MVTVITADDGQPPLSDAQSFTLTALAAPIIEPLTLTNGKVTLSWAAFAGYRRTRTRVDGDRSGGLLARLPEPRWRRELFRQLLFSVSIRWRVQPISAWTAHGKNCAPVDYR